jgi:hypothetical protein
MVHLGLRQRATGQRPRNRARGKAAKTVPVRACLHAQQLHEALDLLYIKRAPAVLVLNVGKERPACRTCLPWAALSRP